MKSKPAYMELIENATSLPLTFLPKVSREDCLHFALNAIQKKIEDGSADAVDIHVGGKATAFALIEPLPWDSALYGMSMARVSAVYTRPGEGEAMVLSDLFEHIQGIIGSRGYSFVDCHVDADRLPIVHAACQAGFKIMATHLGIVWNLDALAPPPESSALIRAAAPEDAPLVGQLAADSVPPFSRFAIDPVLRKGAGEVFRHWAENSVKGYADHTHIAFLDNEPVGYCTWKILSPSRVPCEKLAACLDLTAVLPKARGRGALKALVHGGLCWASEQGADHAYVFTHALNTGMQRVCCGTFPGRTLTARHTLHWHALSC